MRFYRERRDLLEDAVIEAIEDIGLARAISEGIKTSAISEDEIGLRCSEITIDYKASFLRLKEDG